jgi:hypothetical protein
VFNFKVNYLALAAFFAAAFFGAAFCAVGLVDFTEVLATILFSDSTTAPLI